jgi:uroporphyrinogen-III decarboxylase
MKGADPFMSEEQFEEFYWPSLRALIEALIEKGLLVYVFTQGCNDERLKYFAAFPPGNLVIHLESTTDIFKAKKVLAGKQCIDGNVPNSILTTGSEQDVEDYCRKLIDICGKEGGFIMDFSAFLDNCLISNIRKMVDVTQKYGKY